MGRRKAKRRASEGGSQMRGKTAACFFRTIQAALLPVGTAGYLMAVPKLLRYSRKTAVSATLFASLYTRYMQHRLGTRPDEPAARLMRVMPNVSRPGFRLQTAPTLVGHSLTGYVPRIYRYPYPREAPLRHQQTARTSLYDAALQRHLPGIDQLVILGAGFDTRAFKTRMLKGAGLATDRASYVPADFQTEDWFGKLLAAGYDPGRPAFFLWESVTMYLDRGAVEGTLRRIAGTASGGVVAFDYFSAELIASRSLLMRYARAATRFTGEPLTFGIDNAPPARERAAEFVGAFGLALEEHRNFGTETRRRAAPAGFAVAVVGRARSVVPAEPDEEGEA
jgi:hypothetical protein